MKKKKRKDTYDEDFPSKHGYVVPDFLPPPEELAKARSIVVMTIGLDAETIGFFKKEADKRGTKYQKMIREVLARYAQHYGKNAA